ncbi:hypothetical protein [Clostridium sp. BJN0001]|uniref:hypothetical protein n=1 Tax=Clostridium sp. BJN0001 TaxID=2930219 RepID=UPI001FD5CB61|nr:hypothetical protein [Clostridium sp. BJN0001]
MKNDECNFIPSSLAACFIDNKEVHIMKMSSRGIFIRTIEAEDNITKINMSFYDFSKSKYQEIEIRNIEVEKVNKNEFYYIYKIIINDENYVNMVNFIFRDYSRYVTLKNYGEENEFSEVMTGYPAEKDFDFYEFYDDQKKDLIKDVDFDKFNYILKDVELACTINTDELCDKYLLNNIYEFTKYYLEDNYIYSSSMLKKKFSRIYIGNEFCHNLFPKKDILLKMLNKALLEKVNITICFTYMRECYIEKNKEILEKIYKWCKKSNKKVEIVINDWGMIKLICGKEDFFSINLGILLNKRKKDPRFIFKKGFNENRELLSENSLNVPLYREFLKQYGIKRFEFETSLYKLKIPKGKHSLHMPFYITNTSQYCPLYAMCTKMDRGEQILVKNCPKYCTDYIFSYPKHLKMVGKYNSLFSFDDTILKDSEKLNYYLKNGIDRIVLNFI